MKKSPDYYDIINDPEKKIKVYAKVCFDGTSAPLKSSKGASRLPVSNWLSGTALWGWLGVEILYQTNKDGSTDAVTQQEGAVDAAALVDEVEDVHCDTEFRGCQFA